MNVFFYDLLRKAKGFAWTIVAVGGLFILMGGCHLVHSDTPSLDQLASTVTKGDFSLEQTVNAMSADALAEKAIVVGVMLIIWGLVWKPLCRFIMESLEKTFTEEDRKKLGLFPTESMKATSPTPVCVQKPATCEPTTIASTVHSEARASIAMPSKVDPIAQSASARPPLTQPSPSSQSSPSDGTYWLPASALVLAVLGFLASLGGCSEQSIDEDALEGAGGFCLLALSLSITSLVVERHKGKGMAIVGICLSVIGLIILW